MSEISKKPSIKPCPKCGRKRGRIMVHLHFVVTGYYRECKCGFKGFTTSYKSKIGEYWNMAVDVYDQTKEREREEASWANFHEDMGF